MESTHKDDLEKHFLVNLHELLVPLVDIGGLLANIIVIVVGSRRISFVVDTPFDDFLEDSLVDLFCVSSRSEGRCAARLTF